MTRSAGMSSVSIADRGVLSPAVRPIAWIGSSILGVVEYCGGVALMIGSAIRAAILPTGEPLSFARATIRNLDRFVFLSLPITALVHVGLGSFLAMQAYFGATFVDGIGPVVGVGLVRNLAPLISGFILAGLLAPYLTGELRARTRLFLIDEPDWTPDRGSISERRSRTEAPRLVAARILAAAIAGPILALWSAAIGIVVGWAVGGSMLGVSTPGFFDLFMEMLWVRDVVGLVCKGMLFGAAGAIFPCFEGLRANDGLDYHDYSPAIRAACLACVAILVINSGWFLIFYHAGPAFGPTILAPPNQ
ncbi:MAG: ABC transporter permease [Isosphaeraceae bacterium]|nr:ABC transporter permease [Isosphaeraceae bacterium]